MSFLTSIRRIFTGRIRQHQDILDAEPQIRGRYDAAQDSNETKNIWVNSDALDADAANSLAVRTKLRKRSRYERGNNGNTAGIIKTQSNYIVGTGPVLRMQTGSPGTNAMVEAKWKRWCKAVGFARKLRTMDQAKTTDGEAFCILTINPLIANEVKLDITPIECDQFSAPTGKHDTKNYVDGIHFDEYGNVTAYDVLDRHPGSSWFSGVLTGYKTYPANFVCHWYNHDRPRQHRGIPELTPTLNLGAASRRYREAVLAAAETAADLAAIFEMGSPDDGPDQYRPFTSIPIDKRMAMISPAGARAVQLKAEQPATTHESFNRQNVCEHARPLNMPYNIAAADSSGYSFSGGRLDHLTYFVSVWVERDDCESDVCDKVFAAWFEEATKIYGWTFAAAPAPAHIWAWPAMPQIDDGKTATARKTALTCGATSLGRIYAEDGEDFEDEIVSMAEEYGVSLKEMRAILLKSIFSTKDEPKPEEETEGRPPDNENNGDLPVNRTRANGHGRFVETFG